MGSVVLGLATAAFADPQHAAGDHGKPVGSGHADPGKPASKGDIGKPGEEKGQKPDKSGKGKDDKDKDDKDKDDKDKDDKDKPGTPPGLEAKSDERHKKLLERFEERKKTVTERAKSEREEIRKKLGNSLDQQPIQQELRRHARAVARLQRIQEIASVNEKPELAARALAALQKENARHDKRVSELSAAPAPSGGTP
jgi:hypothetical protein